MHHMQEELHACAQHMWAAASTCSAQGCHVLHRLELGVGSEQLLRDALTAALKQHQRCGRGISVSPGQLVFQKPAQIGYIRAT